MSSNGTSRPEQLPVCRYSLNCPNWVLQFANATIVVDIRHQESIACCRTPTPMAPDSSRLDLLQGTLDLLILRALRSGAMHGWAVSERIQQISQDVLRVNQGSLYPALHRLSPPRLTKAAGRGSVAG